MFCGCFFKAIIFSLLDKTDLQHRLHESKISELQQMIRKLGRKEKSIHRGCGGRFKLKKKNVIIKDFIIKKAARTRVDRNHWAKSGRQVPGNI